MSNLGRLAITYNDVCLASNNRLHQVGYTSLWILVVAIGVYYDVGAVLECVVYTVAEATSQTHVARMVYEVFDAVCFCNIDGFVA